MLKSNIKAVIFAVVFLAIYIALNYYLGKKINTIVLRFYSNSNKYVYFIILLILSFSYIVYGLLKHRFQINITWMKNIGGYWLVIFYYMILLFLLTDMISLISKMINFHDSNLFRYLNKAYFSGGTVLIFTTALIIYGSFNAYNLKIVRYGVTTDKNFINANELKIAMIADLHYDSSKANLFSKAIAQINKENVDLICLCGDMLDEITTDKEMEQLLNGLEKLKSKYGIYAINGNHESYLIFQKSYESQFNKIGIKLLKDEVVQVDNGIYIVGRKDVSQNRVSENPRLNIEHIIENIDKSQFLLLLDHQPVDVENVEKHGIDLQLSGHTHKGQFSPNGLVTSRIFVKDYGIYRKNDYSLIVTSGLGTWGPSVRIGSNAEIAFIRIKANQ